MSESDVVVNAFMAAKIRRQRPRRTDNNIERITKKDIRRLARRGGVKRISDGIYGEARGALMSFLRTVIHDAAAYTTHDQRKTVSAVDVIYALKNHGRTLYGFEEGHAEGRRL